jgi:hypothetical protein
MDILLIGVWLENVFMVNELPMSSQQLRVLYGFNALFFSADVNTARNSDGG